MEAVKEMAILNSVQIAIRVYQIKFALNFEHAFLFDIESNIYKITIITIKIELVCVGSKRPKKGVDG